MKEARLQPIKKSRLYESAVDQIKGLILENRYRPGDRLPPERQLAEKLSIGRPSVREALRILGMMGLIEIRPGNGIYVKEVSFLPYIDSVVSSIGSRLSPQTDSFLKLWEVRKILEVESAGLACLRAHAANLAAMELCLRQMEKNLENRDGFISAGIRFHREIAEATGNEILVLIWNSLWDMIRRGQNKTYRGVRSPHRSLQGHQKIYRAFVNKDPEGCRQAMADHLHSEETVLVEGLKTAKKTK